MKLILINNEYYLTTNEKVDANDYGIGFAFGVQGYGAGFYKFTHNGDTKGRLNALCNSTMKVIASTDRIDNLPLINKSTTDIMLERFNVDDLAKKYSEEYAFGGLNNRYLTDGFVEGYKQGENKKFTLKDIENIYYKGRRDSFTQSNCNCGNCDYCENFKRNCGSDYNDVIINLIKNKYSWEVEIELENNIIDLDTPNNISDFMKYKISDEGYITITKIK